MIVAGLQVPLHPPAGALYQGGSSPSERATPDQARRAICGRPPVQPDPAHLRPVADPVELVRVPLGMNRAPELVGAHIASAVVREPGVSQ